ncbi:hypothetical protein [Streptomyces virginiae]|uniref:hypothetical protein n=1 Tax=Streptomyces virginiae TaxID=1961 RepID=UPI0034242132
MTAEWREAQTHRAQATAAADTARLLRDAAAAGAPPHPYGPGAHRTDVADRRPWPDRARHRYRCAAPRARPPGAAHRQAPLTRPEEIVSTPEPAAGPQPIRRRVEGGDHTSRRSSTDPCPRA